APQACATPTAVRLLGLTARPGRGGVAVDWRTGAETDLAGFNVYRGTAKLNHFLIAARGAATGAAYRFVDRTARAAKPYRYRLQLVGRDGSRTWSAAVRAGHQR